MPGIAPGQHGTPSPGQAAPPSIVLFPATLQGRNARRQAGTRKRAIHRDARPKRYQVAHQVTPGDQVHALPGRHQGAHQVHQDAHQATRTPGASDHQDKTRKRTRRDQVRELRQVHASPGPHQDRRTRCTRTRARRTTSPGAADLQASAPGITRARTRAHASPGARVPECRASGLGHGGTARINPAPGATHHQDANGTRAHQDAPGSRAKKKPGTWPGLYALRACARC